MVRRAVVLVGVLAVAACGGGSGGGDAPIDTCTVTTLAMDSDAARTAYAAGGYPVCSPLVLLEVPGTALDRIVVHEGVEAGAAAAAEARFRPTHVAASALPCNPGVSVVAGIDQADLASTPEDGTVVVTTPVGGCTYDVVQVALVADEDFDPATAGVGREGALVLATPGPQDGVRQVVVAELDVTSTTTTAAPTTTTAPVVQIPQPTGRNAVDALLGDWRAGDRAAALSVADPTAVDALFAVPVAPTEDRGCTQPGANPNVQCVFRLPAGELQVRAVPRAGGFVVDLVILSPAG